MSPGGIHFSGFLCRQESDWLGTLAVTCVEGRERLEFIPGMPKIPYPYQVDRHGQVQLVISIPPRATDARFTIKLDGTWIIFYALRDEEGSVLEVIPLALALHTGIRHHKLLAFPRLAHVARVYGFQLVESIEVATPDAAGLATAYRAWQEQMEAANAAAGAGRYVQEGAMLVISTARVARYYKCKPPSIEEIHWRTEQSIGREVIRQALDKMRENGYDFAGGQVEDLIAELENDFQKPHVEQQEN